MGIAMARAGGLGVIHRFLTIEAQAQEVRKVKAAPVAPPGEDLTELQLRRASVDSQGKLMVAATLGIADDTLRRAEALLTAGVDALVLDVAHGHSVRVIETMRSIKKRWPSVQLVVGNIATREAALDLVAAGADGLEVGVGPGSACITRTVTGCGVPQLTAILDCAPVGHEAGVPIVANGGVKAPGDITKALAAGASTVMLGHLLAGADESPGDVLKRGGKLFKRFRGMASRSAMAVRYETLGGAEGSSAASVKTRLESIAAEGVEALVPFRGSTKDVLAELVGGLRSGMSYCNASSIGELWSRARFVRITPSGWRESGSHDLIVENP
jgi:IMP dehydrogenase